MLSLITYQYYRSLRRNIDNFQVHLLSELDFQFSVIGLTETRNRSTNIYNLSLPNYNFEYISSPIRAGGVDVYINDTYRYDVLEKRSNVAL